MAFRHLAGPPLEHLAGQAPLVSTLSPDERRHSYGFLTRTADTHYAVDPANGLGWIMSSQVRRSATIRYPENNR